MNMDTPVTLNESIMLRTPTSATFDFSAGQANSKMTVDEDEADLTVLEESLKSTDDYCTEISRKLEQIATQNAKAIRTMKPLMSKISKLKLQQNNINSTVKLVDRVKGYASDINELDKQLKSNEQLQNLPQIRDYCKVMSRYEEVRKLIDKGLDGFVGLTKGLDESIKDGEVTLKYEMLSKLKKLGKMQMERPHRSEDDDRLITQIKFIYQYMGSARGKDLSDNIVRERSAHVVDALKTSVNLKLPGLVKDQNYLYGGAGKGDGVASFVDYCGEASGIFEYEAAFLKKILPSSKMIPATLREVTLGLFDEVLKNANNFGAFVTNNKSAYGTLLYEVVEGIDNLLKTASRYQAEPSEKLASTQQGLLSRCRQIFTDFFEFVNQRYREMIVPEHPNETLNNTFMMLITRLNKFSAFKSRQIYHISRMSNGSWLPAYRPKGFQEIKTASQDPEFLLSTFYTDVIELSYYTLMEKFQPRLTEEDLGVMLLFNLDGLQNLLDSRSQLKGILGLQGIARLDRLKKKAIDKATVGWSDMTTRLMEASTKQGDSFNMSSKEMGKFIDEFTKTFNDNYRKLQDKNLPPFFKKELAQNIRKMLGPSYRVFYMSVSMDPSAKAVLKHFKYSINDFEHMLVTLA